jgi:hypothetical protein
MARSTSARGDDIGDTMERVAQQAFTELYEWHLQDTTGTSVALFPIWDESDQTWRRHMDATCDTTLSTYREGWAFTAQYAHHVSSLLQEVMLVGTFQCMRLEEYD